MLVRNLLFMVILLSVVSCSKEEKSKATINYYITSPRSTNFEFIQFKFDYIRAIQNNGQDIQTINLKQPYIQLDLNNPAEIFLGSSSIEPREIEAYNYSLSEIMIVKENDTISLDLPIHSNNTTDASLFPKDGEVININLVLDVDASAILGVAGGENWLDPHIAIHQGVEPIW